MLGAPTPLSETEEPKEPVARIGAHLDLELECARPLAGPARYRLNAIDKVRLGRGDERVATKGEHRTLSIAIPDAWMSAQHAELALTDAGWSLSDLGSKNGTLRNGERVLGASLADGDRIQLGRTFFRFRAALRAMGPELLDARDLSGSPPGLRTFSPPFADLLRELQSVAGSKVPVLLLGESGTGKEVLAQAVHRLSRRSGDFVAVNCGAIPHELVESELFGHRKGAFSGAHTDRRGFVRQSEGGTLFLDEIGDLPLPAQAALLRVLQEAEVVPVGSDRAVGVDLRVVAATHRQLRQMVRDGSFRHDLLARLDGASFQLPPLRERRDDVPLLISSLLAKLAPDRLDVELAPEAAQSLLDHPCPLNIRELMYSLQRALARAQGRPIERSDLPAPLGDPGSDLPSEEPSAEEAQRRAELVAMLGKHRGNLAAVARA